MSCIEGSLRTVQWDMTVCGFDAQDSTKEQRNTTDKDVQYDNMTVQ